jgi:hypothetical protein
MDREARKAIVWQMQKLVNTESPYITIADTRVPQAYRSADWAGWVRSPAAGGVIMTWYSNGTYVDVHPATVAATAETGSSSSLPVVLAVIGVVVAAIVVVVLVRRRGGRRAEEA